MHQPTLAHLIQLDGDACLNYAFQEEGVEPLQLKTDDEPNRPNIQLYEHVRGGVDLRGLRVLEVSCGHGGGASYFARTYQPAEYAGLDLNPEAIRHCQARHQVVGLRFQVGDAQKLPFADNSFDVVIIPVVGEELEAALAEAREFAAELDQFQQRMARMSRSVVHDLSKLNIKGKDIA